jgi:hypothetical protein
LIDKFLLIFIGSIALAVIVIGYGPVILASQHDELYERISFVISNQEKNRASSEAERADIAERLVNFLSLYLCDIEEDIDRLKLDHNITNEDRVVNNGTHIKIDSRYVLELPIACVANPSPE